jgi:GNAT superfamily N-acetyltransferase
MNIAKCTPADVPAIMNLYQAARDLQTLKKVVVWPYLNEDFILREIAENRQFKIVSGDDMACNWAITYNDKEIWGDKDKNDAIFLHRICNDPNYRGHRFIEMITEWAIEYARESNKQYVRLDTLGKNEGLIKHYTSAGYGFLGMVLLTDTAALPKHYQDEPNCCLFELKV